MAESGYLHPTETWHAIASPSGHDLSGTGVFRASNHDDLIGK
jgi:hypothetical protein